MSASKGVKKQTLVKVYHDCLQRNDFRFNNKLVKELTGAAFANQFDATKVDRSAGLPEELRREDVFIVHLGGGRHQFVKGIPLGYHELELIPDDKVFNWGYRRGILDGTDVSEAGVLSLAYNQQIIQKFLYEDRTRQVYINVPRRTRGEKTNSFAFMIGDQEINVVGLQIEMDFIIEKREGEIALIEAKCCGRKLPRDFAVGQIYLPFRRLQNVLSAKIENTKIRNLFMIQYQRPDRRDAVRMYEYTFTDPRDMGSIRFIKNAEFILQEE